MKTQQLVVLGMLSAVAYLLMATVKFPILPGAPFLKYDPSDAAALLGGILYGPGWGVAVVFVKDAFFYLRNQFGIIADFIAAATFVAVTAWVYGRVPGKVATRLLWGAAAGIVARVLVMIPANFVILQLQFGMSPDRVAGMLLPAIIPFNALKGLINALLALVVAVPLLRQGLVREAGAERP